MLSFNACSVRRHVIRLRVVISALDSAAMSTTDPALSHAPWEQASTPEDPWPRGWFLAPVGRRFLCEFDGVVITPGASFWSTGVEGECFCEAHAHLSTH
jgi:hypothetical protein